MTQPWIPSTPPPDAAATVASECFAPAVPPGATAATTGLPGAAAPSAKVRWWDGSALQSATLLGVWDGTGLQPVAIDGWWDGAAVQPVTTS